MYYNEKTIKLAKMLAREFYEGYAASANSDDAAVSVDKSVEEEWEQWAEKATGFLNDV